MTAPILDQGTDRFFHSDPFALFDDWYREAAAREPDPNAMACATADSAGRPSVRYVLLKGRDARGFVFFTNYESRKGKEIAVQAHASLAFYWKSIKRQVRVDGTVERVKASEADAYFATRPRDSQVAAWAARQSEPMEERFELEKRFARYDREFEGRPVTRPPHWSGYRVLPEAIEFWIDRPFRLHERILFQRRAGEWTAVRLYP